ncbi:TraB/GumN family protein [Chryseobacterium gregarium]|uniref:TraB/GumN family protein n=1 Tax=Chryseobacterium gregarium TaxID=456299 RepID=UPI0003F546CD|nr:TraB/GumN family protein [Chryseobacterium gregarium]
MKLKVAILLFLLSIQLIFAQETILWKIEKPGSQKVSYLLGTLHQVGNSFVDERPLIKELLSHSDIAVFESVDDKKKTIIDVMNSRPDNFSYREHLDKKDVQFLESISTDWTVPISKATPAELAVKLEQLYVLEVCETTKSTDTEKHLDDYLLSVAEKVKIKTVGLETNADQFKALNSMQIYDWKAVKEGIGARVKNLQKKKDKNQLCSIANTYLSDMNFDYQFNVKCENGAMLSDRNKKWIPQIDQILQNNNAFIAVGLMHIFWDCGIISELRKLGYKVTPVPLLKYSAKNTAILSSLQNEKILVAR